ncbi:uncharacterized protein LOC6609969 [Drosophila sechellia]|nr:uncharacterized protein LOC6609969 [Drosophila sechellia]
MYTQKPKSEILLSKCVMKLPFVSALYTWAADKTNIFQVYQPTGVYTSRQRRKLVRSLANFSGSNMSRWSQLKPMEWCKAVYRDCDSWSFVKCSLAFCAGVLLVRSLDGKLPDSS